MAKKPKLRDDREYDKTQLHENGSAAAALGRDYAAHFFRWSFAKRFITNKDTVLEVGCGQDKPLAKMLISGAAATVLHYTGVDLNKIKLSVNKRTKFHSEFNFVERYDELLAEKPEGWDVVVNMEVIEHMKYEHGCNLLKAMFACTKPGGVLLLSTPVYDGVRHAANHIHEYFTPELQEAIEAAGYIVERRFGCFMDIKHIGKATTGNTELDKAIKIVRDALECYYSNDGLSNIFAPLHPDHSRNNLWICRKPG